MIVCQCKGLNERALHRVVAAGANTPAKIARACGAGVTCGGCKPLLLELLQKHEAQQRASVQPQPEGGNHAER